MKNFVLSLIFSTFALILSGCAMFDTLDTYHYIGIYEVDYKKLNIDVKEQPDRFDNFCNTLRKETGLEIKDCMRNDCTKMAYVVFPASMKTGLNRVVIKETIYPFQEFSISIVKVPAGEDTETTEMKQHIENAFRAIGMPKWIFYIQKSHGQIFNS